MGQSHEVWFDHHERLTRKETSAATSAWIESNQGTVRSKRNRKTANKPPKSMAPTRRSRKRTAADAAALPTPARLNSGADTPLRIPYGNKEVAFRLGARYRSGGWYAPPGVDLAAFAEHGWL